MIKSQLYTAKKNQVKARCWWLLECGWWVSGSISGVLRCCSALFVRIIPLGCQHQPSLRLITGRLNTTQYLVTTDTSHYVTSYRVTAYSDTVKGGPISYHELERVTPYNLLRKGDPYHNLGKGDPILELWRGGTHMFYSLKGISKLCKRWPHICVWWM